MGKQRRSSGHRYDEGSMPRHQRPDRGSPHGLTPVNEFHSSDITFAPFRPKNPRQTEALRTMCTNDLTFVVGPAGTAKTYLAVAAALEDMKSGRATKIIAARPAIEAGDSIGYLKGGMIDKMGPYVRPILDNLGKFIGDQTVEAMQEAGILEITSMTYLRGRTFDDAVLILDEMQNATIDQLKLGITRAGENCRVIVTGDPYQIDLLDKLKSCIHDIERFRGKISIGFVEFGLGDVTRSRIVRTVLECYPE